MLQSSPYGYLSSARKIICIGRNYAEHIKELNNPIPKQPFFFLKPTSSIITPIDLEHPKKQLIGKSSFQGLNSDGSNPSSILIPNNVTVHHEIELALVIDKYLSNLNEDELGPEQVFDSIKGVSLALDLTARNIQDEAKRKGLPWTIGKGFDTFLPISKLIPKSALSVENIQDSFRLTCSINGEIRQDSSTKLMLNPLHKIIQYISTMISLEPGDIILTGTPAGVGEIHPNDHVKCELYQNDTLLVDMVFDCEKKPGPYMYTDN